MIAEPKRFAFEPPTNNALRVPKACSARCQCKEISPCSITGHNPCKFDIQFEANHTHILNEYRTGNEISLRRVCVSTKCLAIFQSPSIVSVDELARLQCYQCYTEVQSRRDSRLVFGTARDADSEFPSSMVWRWRKTITTR